MKKITVPITKLPHLQNSAFPLPYYASLHSAGMDLVAVISEEIIIMPGERELIPTGITIALPDGYEAQIRPRSGLAHKHGITVLNSPGTIDADYRGEIKVLLVNLGQEKFVVKSGDRIAQMIVSEYTCVSWNIVNKLPQTERGSNGFGSTGIGQQ